VGQDSLGTTIENEHNVRRITFSKYQDIDLPIKNDWRAICSGAVMQTPLLYQLSTAQNT
jgi:hypothetical protein